MLNVAVEPVPESEIDCGLPAAESVKLSVAVRVPATVGLKLIDAVQFAPAARLVPHVLLAMLKSPAFVPDSAAPLMVIEVLSPFDNVAVCAALLEPTVVLANVILDGLAVTVPDAPVPFPVSATVCGLLLAESLKFKVAESAPVALGAKTMFAVQLAEAASDVPQVLL